ncbi:PRC-barrel domain-containing protein [Salipaludibacillus sp. HK11]|uniref:PRC-barrel domain containing protein n=1 Tax=Salipaludibacillus sp. HK11 TaxID=3394320 RepID=UPI0039FBD591
MLLHYSWLTSYTVFGNDGAFGQVEDVYFDEEMWTVRYIVIKTGATFLSAKLFVSPVSIDKIDHVNETIRLSISKDEAKKAPDFGEEPVSRKREHDFSLYYRMNPYWIGSGVWGSANTAREMSQQEVQVTEETMEDDNPRVHEARHVTRYELAVNDGTFGKIDDLLVDESSFRINYFIADTKKWLPGGKKVLISPQWIKEIEWAAARIRIDVTRDQLESAPEYRRDLDITDERESYLWLHYRK